MSVKLFESMVDDGVLENYKEVDEPVIKQVILSPPSFLQGFPSQTAEVFEVVYLNVGEEECASWQGSWAPSGEGGWAGVSF